MTATPIILTTVLGLGLLAVVVLILAGLLSLAVVLVRESKKLDGAAEQVKKIAAIAADVAVLRTTVDALEELVDKKMNRIANSSIKRSKKAEEEDEEPKLKLPPDLEFPSLVKSS